MEKIIILGTAESLKRTPWDQKDFDYWACSPVLSYDCIKGHRIDAVFEMHKKSHWNAEDIKKMLNNYIAINPDTIVYMQNKLEEIKNSVKYPLTEIQDMVNHDKLGNYFTSTVGFMVACAIYKNYKRIEMWGCHMAAEEEEYSKQRAGVEAWLNYGLGKGIDYWVTPDAEIMKSNYIYGYDQRKDVIIKMMKLKQAVDAGLIQYEKELQKARDDYYQQKGGKTVMEKLIKMYK